jgi:hypothetical protein
MSRKWTQILLTAAFFSLMFSSCEDLLTDPDGGNMREKLVDTWKVDETESPLKSSMDNYWVEISKNPYDSNRVIIYNFYNVDADAEAVVNGYTLTLPAQTLEGGYKVSGSGQIQGSKANEIIWTYTVDDGSGVAVSVSAVYTRLTF